MDTKSMCICGEKADKYCSKCKFQRYCSVKCQKNDWRKHKKVCNKSVNHDKEDVNNSYIEENENEDVIQCNNCYMYMPFDGETGYCNQCDDVILPKHYYKK